MKKTLFLLPLALFCMGTDQCPLTSTSTSKPVAEPSGGANSLDMGGSHGAFWQVTFDPEVLVTLRANEQAVSQTVQLADGQLTIQGQTIDVANFCWRTDTVCPHQVLPQDTLLIQGDQTPQQILIGFNRRGPLSLLEKYIGLDGQLDGYTLSVPLAVGEAREGQCGLGSASAIMATVQPGEIDDLSATTMQGRVALSYTGLCFNLGGSAAVDNSLALELSMKFNAERQP